MYLKDQKNAKECYAKLMSQESKSYLVDVRSSQEWVASGVADLSHNQEKLVLCEWLSYPSMNINENFFNELAEKVDFNNVDSFYFICAAGIRSLAAALFMGNKLEELGQTVSCINVSDGFEGNPNKLFIFGSASGWKANELPWRTLEGSPNDN